LIRYCPDPVFPAVSCDENQQRLRYKKTGLPDGVRFFLWAVAAEGKIAVRLKGGGCG